MVRDGSVVCPGSDAAVIRIKADSLPGRGKSNGAPLEKFIALTVDCNATYVYLDPYEGAKIAVAEAARNLACSGRDAAGHDGQFEFRQSAQSGIVLAIEGIRARPGRSLPRLQRARSRAAIAVSTTKVPTAH